LVSKKEMERLHARTPKEQFLAFAAYFEAKSPVELFGMCYSDTAAQVYSHWEGMIKENHLSRCLNAGTLRWKLVSARTLRQWQQGVEFNEVAQHFNKLREYIKKLLQKNKELSEGVPKQVVLSSSRDQAHSYFQKAAELLSVPSRSPVSMGGTLKSNLSEELGVSPQDFKQQALFDRLYLEANRKKEEHQRLNAERDAKEMAACTFSPDIRSMSLTRDSVFERYSLLSLSSYDVSSKQDFHSKQRLSKELEGCTFAPSINQSMSSVRSSSPHERLYKLAATQKQSLRHKELEAKVKEVSGNVHSGCTFKPEVNSRREGEGGDVYEKLYSVRPRQHFKQLQRGRRVSEAKAEEDLLKTIPFSPSINSSSKSLQSLEPAHERLYKDNSKQMQKLADIKAEQDKEIKAKRSPSINRAPPRAGDIAVYDRLYAKGRHASPVASNPEFTFKPKISKLPSPIKRLLKSRSEAQMKGVAAAQTLEAS
jgi:hypothetical protein